MLICPVELAKVPLEDVGFSSRSRESESTERARVLAVAKTAPSQNIEFSKAAVKTIAIVKNKQGRSANGRSEKPLALRYCLLVL